MSIYKNVTPNVAEFDFVPAQDKTSGVVAFRGRIAADYSTIISSPPVFCVDRFWARSNEGDAIS
jgi:predicted fused transcriptional regulator/phosphomethylpyrimidine kinase